MRDEIQTATCSACSHALPPHAYSPREWERTLSGTGKCSECLRVRRDKLAEESRREFEVWRKAHQATLAADKAATKAAGDRLAEATRAAREGRTLPVERPIPKVAPWRLDDPTADEETWAHSTTDERLLILIRQDAPTSQLYRVAGLDHLPAARALELLTRRLSGLNAPGFDTPTNEEEPVDVNQVKQAIRAHYEAHGIPPTRNTRKPTPGHQINWVHVERDLTRRGIDFQALVAEAGVLTRPQEISREQLERAIRAYHVAKSHRPSRSCGRADDYTGYAITWAAIDARLRVQGTSLKAVCDQLKVPTRRQLRARGAQDSTLQA